MNSMSVKTRRKNKTNQNLLRGNVDKEQQSKTGRDLENCMAWRQQKSIRQRQREPSDFKMTMTMGKRDIGEHNQGQCKQSTEPAPKGSKINQDTRGTGMFKIKQEK